MYFDLELLAGLLACLNTNAVNQNTQIHMNINRMYTNANKQSIAISDQNVDVDNQKYVDRKENDKERERARE